MFTGIIEEIGIISRVEHFQGGIALQISCSSILNDLKVNDSVCVNGVCLTAVKVKDDSFFVEAVGTTLKKSTFSDISISTQVNLERALNLNDRLGGHLVQGHVNGIGVISDIHKIGENYLFQFNIPDELIHYLVKEGSFAIDGISLTIAELENNSITTSVIPHTWKHTNFQFRKIGDRVNIEIDILAKYVEKLMLKENTSHKKIISENWLKNLGY